MKIVETKIPGCFVIEPRTFSDERGRFVKNLSRPEFEKKGMIFDFQESYYSISQKNVIRGMHFQLPPHNVTKLVYVVSGSVLDVVLDLRLGSPTFKEAISFELSAINKKCLYIPFGCAHGFKSLADETLMTYLQSHPFDTKSDCGIHFDSFGFDWGLTEPIISERDQALVSLSEFDSPFKMGAL